MGYLYCLEEHINLKRFSQMSELDSGWIYVLTIDGTDQCILEMPHIRHSVALTQVQFLGSWHLKCSRLQTDCRVFNAGERSDVTPARFAPAGPVTRIQQQQQQQRQARPKKSSAWQKGVSVSTRLPKINPCIPIMIKLFSHSAVSCSTELLRVFHSYRTLSNKPNRLNNTTYSLWRPDVKRGEMNCSSVYSHWVDTPVETLEWYVTDQKRLI